MTTDAGIISSTKVSKTKISVLLSHIMVMMVDAEFDDEHSRHS